MIFGEKNKHVTLNTIVGKECVIEGNIKLTEGIRIDGRVIGNIETQGFISLSSTAVVQGDLTGSEILVSGEVQGNVQASTTLEIEKSGKITGDIHTKFLKIHTGAILNGVSRMKPETE